MDARTTCPKTETDDRQTDACENPVRSLLEAFAEIVGVTGIGAQQVVVVVRRGRKVNRRRAGQHYAAGSRAVAPRGKSVGAEDVDSHDLGCVVIVGAHSQMDTGITARGGPVYRFHIAHVVAEICHTVQWMGRRLQIESDRTVAPELVALASSDVPIALELPVTKTFMETA